MRLHRTYRNLLTIEYTLLKHPVIRRGGNLFLTLIQPSTNRTSLNNIPRRIVQATQPNISPHIKRRIRTLPTNRPITTTRHVPRRINNPISNLPIRPRMIPTLLRTRRYPKANRFRRPTHILQISRVGNSTRQPNTSSLTQNRYHVSIHLTTTKSPRPRQPFTTNRVLNLRHPRPIRRINKTTAQRTRTRIYRSRARRITVNRFDRQHRRIPSISHKITTTSVSYRRFKSANLHSHQSIHYTH